MAPTPLAPSRSTGNATDALPAGTKGNQTGLPASTGERVCSWFGETEQVEHYVDEVGQGPTATERTALDDLPPGSRVLDLGCGAGRIALYLAQHGHPVVGVDISIDLVSAAKHLVQQDRLKATFAIVDLLSVPSDRARRVPGRGNLMTSSLKDALHNYLRRSRAGMLAKIDGLSEYDRRRPMTPTGTNLLGLVKHLTFYESYYLGGVFGRAPEWTLPWIEDDSIWQGADMWATPDETSAYLLDRYQAACAHADATIAALEPDAPATVPWWNETKRNTTLCVLMTHMIAETSQHLGHADIIREQIDGTAAPDAAEMGDTDWWQAYHNKIQAAADRFREQTS